VTVGTGADVRASAALAAAFALSGETGSSDSAVPSRRLGEALLTVRDVLDSVPITAAHHAAEIASGWPGSDGSTWSTDTIFLERVGLTTTEYRPDLATWRHDIRYRAIRRELAFGTVDWLTATWAKQAADQALLADLCGHVEAQWSRLSAGVEALPWGLRHVARSVPWSVRGMALRRCRVRYAAVDRLAFTAIIPCTDGSELYLRPAARLVSGPESETERLIA
jgi:hypothetical protein